MKKKTGKRIRCGSPAGAIFVLGVLILLVGGSFAAYTNFQSVKRVVSTGTQSDTMFGSNYLSLISLTDENPPVKRISLAESDNYYTITVIVCNYVWGDETLYNPKNITYTVSAVLTATDGGENLPDGIKEITMSGNSFDTNGTCTLKDQKLAAGKAEKNSYSFRIPKALKTLVYKGYKQDKIEMRGDRAEMSDFPLYLNTVAGGLDRRDQTIGGFSFVVKIYAVPVVEIIG